MSKTILILAANPKNTSRLRLDKEVREIDNGLQRAKRRDEFILKQKWAARPVDVRRAMLDYKPNIVHFCGHGDGDEGLIFENEVGNAKLISAEALADFFELFADTVECVVLNACYSEIQAEAIAHHINYVVGMNNSIGDDAAIEFSVAFYDAIGVGKSIEFAHKLACNAIQWSDDMLEYSTPILKSKKKPNKFKIVQVSNKKPELPKRINLRADVMESIFYQAAEVKHEIGGTLTGNWMKEEVLVNNVHKGFDPRTDVGDISRIEINEKESIVGYWNKQPYQTLFLSSTAKHFLKSHPGIILLLVNPASTDEAMAAWGMFDEKLVQLEIVVNK